MWKIILIHPNVLDPIDPPTAWSTDQLTSAWFIGNKQTKHFLDE